MDSIGMEHKLHLKKLLLARQKLTPLSAAEQSMASSVRREESATALREGIPDVDTAFSQVRPQHLSKIFVYTWYCCSRNLRGRGAVLRYLKVQVYCRCSQACIFEQSVAYTQMDAQHEYEVRVSLAPRRSA